MLNRRVFLSAFGSGLVALNLTLGFKPTTSLAPEEFVEPPLVEDKYRMVVNLTALEDLNPGDVVVRCYDEPREGWNAGDGARKARTTDLFYGVCENKAPKGKQALVCVHGFHSASTIQV